MSEVPSSTGSTAKRPSSFGILKIRNFRYYWGAVIFSVIGEHIETVIRNWLIWELTHSLFWLMVMVFMHWIPFALLSIPAGSIADRSNRQRVILWCEIGACIAALGMFATTWMGLMNPYWMSGLLIIHSLAGSISNPSRQLFIHDMVGRDHLLSGVALTASIRYATMSIGKPVGGLILLSFGAAFGFFVNALAFLPLILALLTVIRVTQVQRPEGSLRRPFEEFKQGLRHLNSNNSTMATIGIAIAPSIFVGNGFDPFLVIYADSVFGLGARGYTYFITAIGLGALIGVVGLTWMGNVQWKGKLLFVGIFGFCFSMVAFALSKSLPLSLIFLLGFGLFQVIHNSTATAMLLENVPTDMRGRIMGILNFGRLGLRVVNGPFLASLNKLAVLVTVTTFAGNALTLTAAAATIALLAVGLGVIVPNLSRQQ